MKRMLVNIAQAAAAIGVSPAAIRSWHRNGLISFEPVRDGRGIRQYTLAQCRELECVANRPKNRGMKAVTTSSTQGGAQK